MHRTGQAVVALVLVAGCAGGHDAGVGRAADAYGAALRSEDVQRACLLLAPLTREDLESSQQQPCPEALGSLDLLKPSRQTSLDRFGRQARVVVEDADGRTDTWFLSRFDDRWLVVASGCRPRGGGLPYACDLEGG